MLPEWSSSVRDGSHPASFSGFLGRLGNDRAELTLTGLTPGAGYTVLFDLYVFDSWDGDDYGPDTFRVWVDGTAVLDRTISQFNGTQTWTRPADVKGQLGFSGYEDSIFRRVPVTFTASASSVVLGFEGANLQSLDDESWGLDNVEVWANADRAAAGFVKSTLPADGAVGAMAVDVFENTAWVTLNTATATDSANHEMRGAGPNRVFGDADDVFAGLELGATPDGFGLRVTVADGALPPGLWRYTTGEGILDDGGNPVGQLTRTFEVLNPSPVFHDTFEGWDRPEWSGGTRDNSYPGVFSRFLGRHGNQRAELALSRLTPGTSYTVLFDLYVFDTWDGNDYGPDTFRVWVDGKAVLDRTISQFNGTQTWTRPADVKGQLGFGGHEDSIFRRVPVTFMASASSVVLGFEGANLQSLDDESWGLDNVEVWKSADLAALGFVRTTLPTEGSMLSAAMDRFDLWAHTELDPATSESVSVHEVRGAGPNRVFGDGDDVIVALSVAGLGSPGGGLRVVIPGGPLQPGLWRYRTLPGLKGAGGTDMAPFTRGFEVGDPVLGRIEGLENGALPGATAMRVEESPAGLGTFLGHGVGTFTGAGDVDYWRFEAEAGDRVTVTLEATDRPGIYPWVQVRTAADGVVAQAQGEYWEGMARVDGVVLASPGTYYLRVWSDHGTSGYRLRVERSGAWQVEGARSGPTSMAFRRTEGKVRARVAGHLDAGWSGGSPDVLDLGVLGAATTVRAEAQFPDGTTLAGSGVTLALEDASGAVVESAKGGPLNRLVDAPGAYRLRVSSGTQGFRAGYVVTVDLVDATGPTVVSTALPGEGSTSSELIHGWSMAWSEELDGGAARSPASYELRWSSNGAWGDADDVLVPVHPSYAGGVTLTLAVPGPLQPGRYRFTAGTAIQDRSGNPMAAPYVREFAVADVGGFAMENLSNDAPTGATPLGPLGVAEGSFGFAGTQPAGSGPYEIAAGDLDGDGHRDLVVANLSSAELTVLPGHGDGTFGLPRAVPGGGGSVALALGDMDGDGDLDVVASNHSAQTVSVVANLGGLMFAPPAPLTVGPYPRNARLGDLDGDGRPEIVVPMHHTSHLTVLKRLADGTFEATDYPNGGNAWSVAIADVNSDGFRDVVSVSRDRTGFQVLLNEGNGRLGAASTVGNDGGMIDVGLADMDGDGKQDIVGLVQSDGSLRLFRGDGAGGFAPAEAVVGVSGDAYHVVIEDLDADGDHDAVVAGYGSVAVGVFLNRGTGQFGPGLAHPASRNPIALAVGDWNEDGVKDLASANHGHGSVDIWLGRRAVVMAEEPAGLVTALGRGALGVWDDVDYYRFTAMAGDLLVVGMETVGSPGASQLYYLVSDAVGNYVADFYANSYAGWGQRGPFKLGRDGSYTVRVSRNYDYRGEYRLRVNLLRGGLQSEGDTGRNDSPATPSDLAFEPDGNVLRARVAGAISTGDGPDHFLLGNLSEGTTVRMELASMPASTLAGRIALVRPDGSTIVAGDAGQASLTYDVPAGAGPLLARVSADSGAGLGAQYVLSMSVADERAPTVTSVDLPAEGETTTALISDFTVRFSEDMAAGSVNGSANVEVRSSANPTFGDGDDVVYAVVGAGYSGGLDATFRVTDGPLQPGRYQVTLGTGLTDRAGNALQAAHVRAFAVAALPGFVGENRSNNGAAGSTPMGTQGGSDGSWLLAGTLGLGSNPYDIASGNLDGDGNEDLVVANYGSWTASVLYGAGDGTFGGIQTLPCENGPIGVAVGDVDGDGLRDIAIINHSASTLAWHRATGVRTWAAPISVPVGAQPRNVRLADLDGDGLPEVLVAQQNAPFLTVLRHDGVGGFIRTDVSVGFGTWSVAAGEVDGDGRVDVIAVGSGGAAFLRGTGSGLALDSVRPVTGDPADVVLADLDGDGDRDVVVLNRSGRSLGIIRNTATGLSGTVEYLGGLGSEPYHLVASDLDADGDLDLAAAVHASSHVTRFMNAGDGTFGTPTVISAPGSPIGIVVGDWNKDGVRDMATANYNGNGVSIWLGNRASLLAAGPGGVMTGMARGRLLDTSDHDFYRFSARAGDVMSVAVETVGNAAGSPLYYRVDGPDGGYITDWYANSYFGWGQSPVVTLPHDGSYTVYARYQYDYRGEYRLRVSLGRDGMQLEREPNNNVADANVIVLRPEAGKAAGAVSGYFRQDEPFTGDFYRVPSVGEGNALNLTWTPVDAGKAAAAMVVRGPSGDVVASGDAAAGLHVVPAPGQAGAYAVQVLPVAPRRTAAARANLQFSGDTRVRVPLDVPEDAMTVSFWFHSVSPDSGLFEVGGGGYDRLLYLSGGNIVGRIYANESIGSSGLSLGDGRWHHVAYQYGAALGGQRIYVDGVLVASGSKSSSDFNWQTEVVFGYTGDRGHLQGAMEDVSIWNSALPEEQVLALRTAVLDGTESGLIGLWRLDEGTGSTVSAAGGGLPGNVEGAATWGRGVFGMAWTGIETAYVLGATVTDAVAPQVTGITMPPDGGGTRDLVNSWSILFSEDMDGASVNDGANYELRASGNGVFGDSDDVVYALGASGYVSGSEARLLVASGPLQPGSYRFTARTGLKDRAGNPLAAPFVREFFVEGLGSFVTEGRSNDVRLLGTPVGTPGNVMRELARGGDDYGTPSGQHELAKGDMDGDGIEDLVVPSGGNPAVRMFRGRGDGTFHAPVDIHAARHSTGISVGDLDGDGRMDLVLANYWDHGVTMVRNLGGMVFGPPTFMATGQNPLVTRIVDLDRDGTPEVLVANRASLFLTVLRRSGDGGYARTDVVGDGRAFSMAIGDVNGDGAPDVVTANEWDNTVSVYLNDGSGALGVPASLAVGQVPRAIGMADMDGDGDLDVVVSQAGPQSVGVLMGAGDGTFEAPVQYPGLGSEPWFLAVDDLDGDGRSDVVVAAHGSNRLVRYFNELSGALGSAVALPGNNNPIGVVTGDWNRDGVRDVAAANYYGGITIWMGTRRLEIAEDPAGLASVLVRGSMEKSGDEDWYRFTAGAGDLLQVGTETEGSPAGSTLYVDVFAPSGAGVLGEYSSGNGTLTTGSVTLAEDGEYAMRVRIPWWWGNTYRGEYRAWVGLARDGLRFEQEGGDGDGVGSASPVAFARSNGVLSARVAGHVAATDAGDVFALGHVGMGTSLRAVLGLPAASPVLSGLELLDGSGAVVATSAAGSPMEHAFTASGTYFVRIHPTIGRTVAGRYVLGLTLSDTTPPSVASTSLPAEGSGVVDLLDAFEVTFSEEMDAATVNNAANVEVRVSANAVFGDGDDVVLPVASPGYASGSRATYGIPGGPVGAGFVQVTMGTGLRDRGGNAMAAAFVRQFEVRSREGFVREGGNNDTAGGATRLGTTIEARFDGSFTMAGNVGAANRPYDIHGIDLDGDGLKDMVVANAGANSVMVYRGHGDGTFGAPRSYATGDYPYTLLVADLTADGKPDLATANFYGHSVTIWRGAGDGTFDEVVTLPSSDHPSGIASGDIDGDGKAELLVTRWTGSSVDVFRLGDSGAFVQSNRIATRNGPSLVSLARIDGDAFPDVVVSIFADPSAIAVYRGDGMGGFGEPLILETPVGAHTFEVRDLDGDGSLDIVVANEQSASLSVFKGNGDGTFGARTDLPAGNRPYLRVADIDGDARPELFVGNYGSSSIGWYRNRGDGTFADPVLLGMPGGAWDPTRVAIEDWNADGVPDIASANYGSGNVSIFLGNRVQSLAMDPVGRGIRAVAAYGRLSSWGDADHWSFGARAGDRLVLASETPGRPAGSSLVYRVFSSAGVQVAGFSSDHWGTGQDTATRIPSDGTYHVVVTPNSGYYGEYRFRLLLTSPDASPEREGNDGVGNASGLVLAPSGDGRSGVGVGHIHSAGDIDYYDLGTVQAGETIFLNARLLSGGTFQPVVGVYDAGGGYRPEVAGGRGFDAVGEVDVMTSGRYHAAVRASGSAGGLREAYALEVLVVPTSTVGLPNLQVTSVGTPAGPVESGASVTVEFEVSNVGRQPTGATAWTDRVILSANATLGDIDDIPLGVVARSGELAAGEGYAVSRTFRVPDGIAGDFHVLVQADSGNAVAEFVLENDNLSSSGGTVRVNRAAYPDLIAELPSVSKGATLGISWTLSNRGEGTGASGWKESVALRDVGTGTIVWREVRTIDSPMAAEETAVRMANPPWPQPGRYHAEVVVDIEDAVYEFNASSHASAEANNLALVPVDVERDLTVANLRIEPAGTIRAGDTVAIRWDRVVSSDDPGVVPRLDRVRVVNRTTGAVLLDTTTDTGSAELALPLLGAGVGQIEATVTLDADNLVHEFALARDAEANNTAVATRASEPAPTPDLAVAASDPPTSADAGQPVPLSWTVSNHGNAAVGGPWRDDVYLSTTPDLSGARLIGSLLNDATSPSGGSLAAGASVLNGGTFTVPSDLSGDLHLVVVTDAAGVVTENSELDNRAASAGRVRIRRPNLVPSAVTAPAFANAGGPVEVRWKVTNGGDGATFSGWRASVGLSASADGSGETVLGTLDRAEVLGAGAEAEHVATVTLPPGIVGGRHLVVTVDTLGQVTESNEADNASVSATALDVRAPDLAVASVTAAATVVPGVPFEVRWTSRNAGTDGAAGPWTESVYLSSDDLVGGDTWVADVTVAGPVTAGASFEGSARVTVPVDGPAGTFRIVVVTDSTGVVAESNESDNGAISDATVTVPPVITVTGGAATVAENGGALTFVVTRNGDRGAELVVGLASSSPGALTVPGSVTIPAGSAGTSFAATPVPDGVVAGDRATTLTVSAAGRPDVTRGVTVTEVDVPSLALGLDAAEVDEGLSVPARVTRDPVTAQPLVVTLVSSAPSQFLLPTSVTIPAHEASVAFAVVTVDDEIVEADVATTLAVAATGFTGASRPLTVRDGDTFSLAMALSAGTVSEGAGAAAATGTVTRSPVTAQAITVALATSDATAATVPGSVTIEAGRASATFNVGAVDDAWVDGSQPVQVSASASVAGRPPVSAAPAALVVTDDDGPMLTMALGASAAREGGTVTATVRRNTSTAAALVVAVSSDNMAEAVAPATVEIPAGAVEATFPVTTMSDGVTDGAKTARIAASAAGHQGAEVLLTVTDADLPDLVVAWVQAPGVVETESVTSGRFRVENRGNVAATGPFLVRLYTSADAAVGGDTFVGQYNFPGTLPAGGHFELDMAFTAPRRVGALHLVAEVDPVRSVVELAEDNNAAVSAGAMDVRAAYTAVAYTDVTVGMAGSPVPIRGTVTRSTGAPAVGASVTVHVVVRGTRRTLGAIADGSGSFSVTFNPLPGEAGNYEVAAAHPGVSEPAAQDAFTLLGIRIDAPGAMRVVEASSAVSGVRIYNLSDVPVAGFGVEATTVPGGLTVTPSVGSDVIAGNGWVDVAYAVAVADGTTSGGMVRFRVSGGGGITGTFEVPVIVDALRPSLVAVPGAVEQGMRRGAQTTVRFDLVNLGGRPTGPLRVLTPPLPWMRVAAGGDVSDLRPGETNPVTVVLTPPPELPLGPYGGSFFVQGEQASVNVPFNFRALSESLGNLRVEAVDEFTYYAEGEPRVAGATVVVLDAVTGAEVARAATGTNGIAQFDDLREDYYRVEVTADGHGSFRATHLVEAAKTKDVTAFLPRQTVRYRWTVEPIQVEERTRITIETVFEAAVPVPVVTMTPSVVDLSEVVGDETQVDLTLTNHGLIAAKSGRFVMPAHPGWEFIPLITEVGDIPAQSSMTVPMTVRRLGGAGGGATVALRRTARTAGGGGPCVVGGGLIWELVCGPRTNVYTVPITFNNAGTDCGGGGVGGSPGGWTGGFGGGGGGGGVGGGPNFVFNPPDVSLPDLCDCRTLPRFCVEAGIEFDLSSRLEALVSAILSKLPGARLTEAEMKVEFSGDLCTCCINNQISWEGKVTGVGSIKAQVELGPGVAADLPFEAPPPWKDVAVDGRALAGVRLTLTGSVQAVYERECGKEPTLCMEGNAHLQAFAGAEFEGNASATLEMSVEGVGLADVGFSGHVGGQLGIEGNIGATFNWCRGEGGSITACGNLVARANIGGTLSATLPNGTMVHEGITLSADRILAGGECDAGGGRVVAAPSGTSRKARVAGGMDGPFTEALPPDLFRLPTAEIAKALNLDRPPDAVCARVKLQLDQEAVLTRDAFRAMLELENADASALADIEVSLRFRDSSGNDAAALFGVRAPEVTGMGSVDGSGALAANTTGKASWVLIPGRDSVGAESRVYTVGGTLSYRQNGVRVNVPLADVPITVHPQPLLTLQYFHQRDVYADDPFTAAVEPSLPYALGVMVRNDGHGQARNFRIASAEPQIVENERGLLIDFQLIGTQVAGEEISPSLTANFGAINAGDIKVARWLFTSSLQGLFIDYSAKFEHIDLLGNPRLSLLDAVSIHEMIRQVEAQGGLADGKPDFLVNDVPDVRDLPDTLYLSQGGTNHVEVVEWASVDAVPSGSDLVVELTATMPDGWAYLRVPEPSNGSLRLGRVVRSDGRELPLDKAWWVTDRTFEGMGRRPTPENILHLLDDDSTGRYTLYYNTAAGEDSVAPASAVGVLPARSPRDVAVAWSGTDDASGIATFDVYVSEDGGPYALWLGSTTLRGALFRGSLGRTYRFYSVATDGSGNRETAPVGGDAETLVAFETRGPVLGVLQDVSMAPSTTLTGHSYTVEDPDTPLDLLGVSFVSSNPALLPVGGIVSVGTGQNRTLSLTPVPGQWGTADLTMRVTDGVETAVRLFRVTVYRPNVLPVAGNDSVSVVRAAQVRIPLATLLANDSDADGDTVVVDSVAPLSAAGGRLQVRGAFVVYTPPSAGLATDSFLYTAGDGHGGLAQATVDLTLTDPEAPVASDLSLVSMRATPQAVVVEFVGVRGRRYLIERSPSLLSPWSVMGMVTADSFGRIRYEDGNPLTTMGYYRITRVTTP